MIVYQVYLEPTKNDHDELILSLSHELDLLSVWSLVVDQLCHQTLDQYKLHLRLTLVEFVTYE